MDWVRGYSATLPTCIGNTEVYTHEVTVSFHIISYNPWILFFGGHF